MSSRNLKPRHNIAEELVALSDLLNRISRNFKPRLNIAKERVVHDLAKVYVGLGDLLSRNFVVLDRAIGGTSKGDVKIFEIGKGSDGTTVFEGFFNDRFVAVKRLVRGHRTLSSKEITRMISYEQHPNIVRYWGLDYDENFMYLSLERCTCSLYTLIQVLSSPSDFSISPDDPPSMFEYKFRLKYIKNTMRKVNLWIDRHPSPLLLRFMREAVCGLGHLHDLEIIHRDLKPQNIMITETQNLMITEKPFVAKLSDVGIIKCLPQSSLEYHADCGTSGWQAPEVLLHGGPKTPATDMFSLGCVLFFCITRGGHPFGERRERDVNIANNTMDLSSVEFIPEAHDLISRLLNADPILRPNASKVLHHPFFWSSEMRLSFLRDVSNRVELEAGKPNSRLLKKLQNTAPLIFGESWHQKIDTKDMDTLRGHGAYDGSSVRDLLRAVRDNFTHHMKASKRIKLILGSIPDGLDAYFAKRYPALLMECYKVLSRFCKKEEGFQKYFLSLSSTKTKKRKSFGCLDRKVLQKRRKG